MKSFDRKWEDLISGAVDSWISVDKKGNEYLNEDDIVELKKYLANFTIPLILEIHQAKPVKSVKWGELRDKIFKVTKQYCQGLKCYGCADEIETVFKEYLVTQRQSILKRLEGLKKPKDIFNWHEDLGQFQRLLGWNAAISKVEEII